MRRLRRPFFRASLLACCLALLPSLVSAKEQTHVVYAGQRLGSIAKRYNVTIEALCAANGLKPTDRIRPGQRLVIPDKDTKPRSAPLPDEKPAAKPAPAKPAAGKPADDKSRKSKPTKAAPEEPQVHVVARGHTLSAISNRYGVTVAAICHATGIPERTQLKIGQRLVIPHKTDPTGTYARQVRLSGSLDEERDPSLRVAPSTSYVKYQKKPWRKGYVTLRSFNREWKGFVLGPTGGVLPQASSKINWALGAREDGPRVDPRLVRLIAQVSDQFGGRPLRIVSGYRTKSFVAASKHKEGRALDFSILGVPNEALRDYLRTLKNVGVGYYPNSSFVHLDVRGYNAFWIDYAGPGEAPRKSPHSRKRPSGSNPPSTRPPVDDDRDDIDHDGPPDDAAPDEFHHGAGAVPIEDPEDTPGAPSGGALPEAAPADSEPADPPPPPPSE